MAKNKNQGFKSAFDNGPTLTREQAAKMISEKSAPTERQKYIDPNSIESQYSKKKQDQLISERKPSFIDDAVSTLEGIWDYFAEAVTPEPKYKF